MAHYYAIIITDPNLAGGNPHPSDIEFARGHAEMAVDHVCWNENGNGCCAHARFDYAVLGGRYAGWINQDINYEPPADAGNERRITVADARTMAQIPAYVIAVDDCGQITAITEVNTRSQLAAAIAAAIGDQPDAAAIAFGADCHR